MEAAVHNTKIILVSSFLSALFIVTMVSFGSHAFTFTGGKAPAAQITTERTSFVTNPIVPADPLHDTTGGVIRTIDW